MSKTLDFGGTIVNVPPNQNRSTPLETRLQKFLKGNLKALGVAQIMIGVKCILYGMIGSFVLNFEQYRMLFCLFYTGFPLWAALTFIISGSLAVVFSKKQTISLLKASLGAHSLSTLVSIAGICLVSYSFWNIFHCDCKADATCVGIKSIATGLVVILVILTCMQMLISLPLSMVKYNVDNKNIDWMSIFCYKSAPEGPYQDLMPRTSIYEELDPKESAASPHLTHSSSHSEAGLGDPHP